VRRVDTGDATVTTFAGVAGQGGYQEGVGGAARFTNPSGITTDGTTLWVADAGNFVIREIDLASQQTSILAGGVGQSGTVNATGAAARFESMRGMAWDGAFLYLIQSNGVLRQIDTGNGAVITVAGMAGQNAFADGAGSVARFDAPRFVVALTQDRLYVSDTENNRPRSVLVANGVGTVTSPFGGAQGYMDGNGNGALFNRQRGLGYAGNEILAVSDSDNFVIRELDLQTKDVTTIAGMANTNAHAEGEGLQAGFDKPLDMHFDPQTGDLFISEGAVLRRMYYK
jgi:hypothetical protein